MPELESAAWRDATAAAHADFLAYNQPTEIPGRLQLGKVVAWLNATLPPEAIMTHSAGHYATWLHPIGRASCRERVSQYVYLSVVAVSLKKKKTTTLQNNIIQQP